MNRYLLCGLVLSATIFGACAQQKKGTKTETKTTTSTVKNTTDITSIEIHRGNCFGKCPDYRLTVTETGKATYVGRRFSDYPGTYEGQVNVKEVVGVFNEFKRYRVDTCSERYKPLPDIAGLEITIIYKGGREQLIRNANSPFAPSFLKGLAEEIDRIAPLDVTAWKKTESWSEETR